MFKEKWENTETGKRYKTRLGAGLDGHKIYMQTNKKEGDHGINYLARILTVLSVYGHSSKNIRKIQR